MQLLSWWTLLYFLDRSSTCIETTSNLYQIQQIFNMSPLWEKRSLQQQAPQKKERQRGYPIPKGLTNISHLLLKWPTIHLPSAHCWQLWMQTLGTIYTGSSTGMRLFHKLGWWTTHHNTHHFWNWRLHNTEHLVFQSALMAPTWVAVPVTTQWTTIKFSPSVPTKNRLIVLSLYSAVALQKTHTLNINGTGYYIKGWETDGIDGPSAVVVSVWGWWQVWQGVDCLGGPYVMG